MYFGSPQPVQGGGHHQALPPELEAMLSTVTPLAAKSVMSQAACSALEEVRACLFRRVALFTFHVSLPRRVTLSFFFFFRFMSSLHCSSFRSPPPRQAP